MANQEPVIFCNAYPCETSEFSGTLRMPMGAQPMNIESARCCEGIYQTLGGFSVYLSMLYPFLKLISCVTAVIGVFMALKNFLEGFTSFPPPSLTDFTDAIAKVARDCAYPLSLIPASPVALLGWLYFIFDLISYILALLRCLRSMLMITFDNDTEALKWQASMDPFMRDQAECLLAQNNQLKDALLFKISAVRILLEMMAIVTSLLPGIPGVQVDLTTNDGQIHIEQLDIAINTLSAFKEQLRQLILITGGTP